MTDPAPPLFGLGTHSHSAFADNYRTWLSNRNRRRANARMPVLRWLGSMPKALPPAEIYLIETVKLFMNLRPHLPSTATVVLSDSPLLLMELPVQPLDWVPNGWVYRLQPVDCRAFEEARLRLTRNPTGWMAIGPNTIDRLGLMIDETATGSICTPLNGLLYQLDYGVRHRLQLQLARYLKTEIDLRTLETEINRELSMLRSGTTTLIQRAVTQLIAALKTHGVNYQTALALLTAKKSIAAHVKKQGLDDYEVKFLYRMLRPPRSKSNAA